MASVFGRVALGLSVLALAIFIARPIMLPAFHFPIPVGSYAIGALTYHWVDTNRAEVFSTDANARRELMVQIWYRAKSVESLPSPLPRAPYVQSAAALALALARLKNLPAALFGQLEKVTTHAILGLLVADDKPNYPVLTFAGSDRLSPDEYVPSGSIGLAALHRCGHRSTLTAAVVVFPDRVKVGALPLDRMIALIHQSHRPVAIAPTFNGRTFAGGIVPYLAQDVGFTLNQLAALNRVDPNAVVTRRLNLEQIGTFGISLGSGQ
jgi:hypothetical protein